MRNLFMFLLIVFFGSCKKEQKEMNPLGGDGDVEYVSELDLNNILGRQYSIYDEITPSKLAADFNGDGLEDKVLIIKEGLSEKIGLLFLHSNRTYFIVGAGNVFTKDGWDNMNWLEVFKLDNNKDQTEFLYDEDSEDPFKIRKLKIPNIGVVIREKEGSGGLLYFDGKKYQYLHQGD